MSATEQKVWAFVVSNPDHWPLLRDNELPPEVSALPPEDLEAFEAARAVAQARALRLLRVCWGELRRQAAGTELVDWMSKAPRDATLLANKLNSTLPNYKGSIYLTLWEARKGLCLWATLYCAKMRFQKAREAWGEGETFWTDGSSLNVLCRIDPEASDADNAKRFTDDYWPRLARWMGYKSSAGDERKPT